MDVVLPKDEGEFKIHRFRIICLVESDLNASLGMLLARPLGHFLKDLNEYPGMQYGSRDGQMSISAVLNKILTFDMARLLKIVMATEENDAIGCYDRVMQQMVALYLICLGIAISLLTFVCRTFDETKHYIKKLLMACLQLSVREHRKSRYTAQGRVLQWGHFFGF